MVRNNGYHCGEDVERRRPVLPGNITLPEPDFVISTFPPRSLQGGIGARKAWLIGDVKFRSQTAYNDIVRNYKPQTQAIFNFAKKHEYVPIASYVTIFGNSAREKEIEEFGASKGVITQVFSVLSR
jgi:hypothetical protein